LSDGKRRTGKPSAHRNIDLGDVESAAKVEVGPPPEGAELLQQTLYDLRVHQIELEMQNEELRRAQIDLEIARGQYFDLYDLAPVAYCTLDETGLIVRANLTAVNLLRIPRSKLLKRPFRRFVTTEDHGQFQRLFHVSEPQAAELRMKRDDGTLFWAEVVVNLAPGARGTIERRLVMSDVTERKAAEAARREGEARFRELFSRASDGIVISTFDGDVIEANAAFARMHGFTPDEVLHRNLKSLDVAGTWLTPALAQRITTGEVLTLEVEHRHRAGHTFPLEASVGELSVGGVPHALGFYRDITERKRLRAAFALNDRLASMGMLSAGIAHEINNPLTYVLSNLESVADELPRLFEAMRRDTGAEKSAHPAPLPAPALLDDVVGRVRGALEGAQRIKTIAHDLGSFSRIERGSIGSVDVNRALASALTLANNELKYRAKLVNHLGDVPPVRASEGKLVQVFLNLLINAVQAIPEGHVEENQVTIRTWSTGDAVFAEVLDTGRGIPGENLAHIFEPFFTTKEAGVSGSGLGLAICKSLLGEFGGDLRVESAPGRTSFVVQLEVSTQAPAIKAPVVAVPPPAPTPVRGRILIVDDEDLIRRALARMLGREHEVVAVESGEQARALLRTDAGFDVVLCDLMMPEMTGMELHALLAKTDPVLAARVIFISGGAFTPPAAEYLSSVENTLVEKPFNLAELSALVTRRVAAVRTAAVST
jgi:PAS domain S-box-containing protein